MTAWEYTVLYVSNVCMLLYVFFYFDKFILFIDLSVLSCWYFNYRDQITDTVIKIVEYSNKFAAYSNADNDHAMKLLDNFARQLFAWRRPYPKFRQSQARTYGIFRIKNLNNHLMIV